MPTYRPHLHANSIETLDMIVIVTKMTTIHVGTLQNALVLSKLLEQNKNLY